MLIAMRENAGRLGYPALVAPVRPNRKHLEPRVPMNDYIARTAYDHAIYVEPNVWVRHELR